MKSVLSPPPLKRALTVAVGTLVATLFVVIVVVDVAFNQLQRVDEQQTRAARAMLGMAQQVIGHDLMQEDLDHVERLLVLFRAHAAVEAMTVIDASGRVLLSSKAAEIGTDAAQSVAHFERAVFDAVRAGRRPELHSSADGDALIGYAPLALGASPGQPRPDTHGALILRYDLTRARLDAWRAALAPQRLVELSVAAATGIALLLLLINRWVSRPLRQLGDRVARLARGDDGVVSDLRGDSEIARLGRDFDNLSRQIRLSAQALQDANRDLEQEVAERTLHLDNEIATRTGAEQALRAGERNLRSVLEALNEGVALWHTGGVLQYANPAMKRLCNEDALIEGQLTFNEWLTHFNDEAGNPLPAIENFPGSLLSHPDYIEGMLVRVDAEGRASRWYELSCTPTCEDDNEAPTALVSALNDVTQIQLHNESMARLANFDTLTGLPNRNLLHDRMLVALAHNRRSKTEAAICYLDLDGFKAVNDTYGHDVGDALLQEAARRLGKELRGADTVARLGGDEFVVLLGNLPRRWDCEPILKRMLKALATPYTLSEHTVDGVSASIGVTSFPSDDSDPDTLLRHADHAMYVAKRAGKNRFRWFSQAHEQRREADRATLRDVRDALHNGHLLLHYQPKVDCRRGIVTGAEALIRWQHPVLGLLPPVHFLPLIENTELANEVGDFVIEQALRQVVDWRAQGLDLTIGVNLFVRQLQQGDFVARLAAQIDSVGDSDACGIQLEIIESAALEGIADIEGLVERCRGLGVAFALDDFGTGYSTLDHLLRIPADVLKIDRSFIRDMLNDAKDMTLIKAVIGLGLSFECDIVAEGVEELAQIRALLDIGCDVMQGFYFAPPMSADDFVRWVRAFHPDTSLFLQDTTRHGYANTTGFGI